MEPQRASAKYLAVVVGVSAGGMKALPRALATLPANFPVPVIVVQHRHPQDTREFYINYLNEKFQLTVKEADEKEMVKEGCVYIVPANYHLLLESDKTFSLTVDEKVNYSRPSIDVTFKSVADVFGEKLIGIILTGANSDGAMGLKTIKDKGGITIVQDPLTAESAVMPQSAIRACDPDYVLPLDEIASVLIEIVMG